jgi:acetyl esterase
MAEAYGQTFWWALGFVVVAFVVSVVVLPKSLPTKKVMGGDMSELRTKPTFELAHTALSEAEALRFLEGHRISLGGRTMDPKAQIVGEFVKSIRVPGYFPPVPELRQQLRTMVALMDEPAPALPRIEDISIPGPGGALLARVYDPVGTAGTARPVLAYFHGGGWVQGDLETHHGLCARLSQRLARWSSPWTIDWRPSTSSPRRWRQRVAAYRWPGSHWARIGGDPARVGVAGDSAGGNLAAVVSQRGGRGRAGPHLSGVGFTPRPSASRSTLRRIES